MRKFLTSILIQAICLHIYAIAPGSIKGKIIDAQTKEALEFVNVRMQKADGSVQGGITDQEGLFYIDNLPLGNYSLIISYMGYKTIEKELSITASNSNIDLRTILLSEDSQVIGEVEVVGQKSQMRFEIDKKVFNVDQDISSTGGTASDILSNIPSVEVDNDGNVSLRGNSSVEVWINGKSSGLTSDNRAQILQQLPAESIEKIEVIDNPSAKFSAEGSAGIINIVLKKNRKAGYYGSLQAGGGTRGGANTSFNINYNSSKLDAYANIGYRHRSNDGRSESDQVFTNTGEYQRYRGTSKNMGNNLFTRAGITWHATDKDDISFNGMMMFGGGKNRSDIPYRYGTVGDVSDSRMMLRRTRSKDDMRMLYGELNYRHNFSDKHFIDFTIDANKWKRDNDNFYQDSTVYYSEERPTEYDYQYRPMYMNNNRWEMKLDYENQINDRMKVEAGYQGNFSHENSPQESFVDDTSWDGANSVEDKDYFNRFIYDMDLHALYATFSYKLGKLGVMGGLRGEYWKVNTESYTWEQEHDASKRDPAFKKDYFQLFPSLFLSYQLTETQQLQLNYTRRLRRPWGGQLNSFRDTRDATMVSFGNPELTPEFSNSFSLNYLKTWNDHSLLVSAYYRPTSDVIQRINYQSSTDGLMYSTSVNVAKSLSSGLEVVLKNKLFRILDLTTTANAYYYKLNGFSYDIDGQTVTGKGNDNFTWNARMTASLILPYDISVQATGRYNARQVITQGYRKANYSVDLGARKNFFNKALTVAVNCRDLLNSRKWVNYTESDTFTRYQMNKRGGRNVNLTVTWNFGNMKAKKKPQKESGMPDYEGQQYGGEGGEM